MSINCVNCIRNQRTGTDLLCDECREKDKTKRLYEAVATCPECQGQLWYIHLDGFKHDYENITEHECGECRFKVIFGKET